MAAIRKLASSAYVIHISLLRLLGKHPKPLEHIASNVADLCEMFYMNNSLALKVIN